MISRTTFFGAPSKSTCCFPMGRVYSIAPPARFIPRLDTMFARTFRMRKGKFGKFFQDADEPIKKIMIGPAFVP
jgi:hypothetical protein